MMMTAAWEARLSFSGGRWFRAVMCVLVGGLALAPAVLEGGGVPAARGASESAFDGLPLAAKATIAETLGRGDRSFHATAAVGGFEVVNERHRLAARFSRDGMLVRSGGASFGLSLRAWGYGDRRAALTAVAPRARANRVSYTRAGLEEWWVNGPLGLQQGFTVGAAPAPARSGPLTLELGIFGSLQPSLERGGDGLALRSNSGHSLRYSGLVASDARGRSLPAWLDLGDGRLLVRVDDARARYPVTIDPFVQEAKLTASEAEAGDDLGRSVAVSGDTVVVGAPFARVGSNADQGSVYVFEKPAAGWASGSESAKFTATDGADGDQLGYSVAISGDTVVVGARADDDGSKPCSPPFLQCGDHGSVYVFEKSAAGWASGSESAKLIASDGSDHDHLGQSVAVSGDTVVAGASDTAGLKGGVYVFKKPAAGWASGSQTAKLTASDGEKDDALGHSVAVSGDTIVAGAPFDTVIVDADSGVMEIRAGSVYLFQKPTSGWASGSETAKLTASPHPFEVSNDFAGLGHSVAVSGDTVVAGAPFANGYIGVTETPDSGSVHVFEKPAAGWASGRDSVRLAASDRAESDWLGTSVALSGDTVVAGAPFDDVGSNTDQGSVYVFEKPAAGWASGSESAKLTASQGSEAHDFLGSSVAVSGDTIIAGAPNHDVIVDTGSGIEEDLDAGSAYLFQKPGTGWANGSEEAKLTASQGSEAHDFLGSSVAVSGDTVVVGAPFARVGSNADQGAVYVFEKPATGWASGSEVAMKWASDGADRDELGDSVAISGDTVVAGAPALGGLGSVYVFEKPAAGWVSGSESAKLIASDGTPLGNSVAVSGDTVVAGVPSNGTAYLFEKPAAGWASGSETAKLTASDGGQATGTLGSVAVADDTVVVGAPRQDVSSNGEQGAVHVFEKPATGWASGGESAKLTASDGAQYARLGGSVAVSGATVVAGAGGSDGGDIGSDPGRGAVYVFEKPATGWASGTESAKLTASDGADGDELSTVALSGDTVVAGAPNAVFEEGAVYVFEKPATGWASGSETAKLTASPGETGAELGSSVAVSGGVLVAGAPGAGRSHGAAYVFVSPNKPPSCTEVTASPGTIPLPRGDQLKRVSLSGATDPDGDPLSYRIDVVTQDEPVQGVGDHTFPDAEYTEAGANSNEVLVRAGRNPLGDGRVYRIAYTVSDGLGGSCSGTAGVGGDTTAEVSVPRKRNTPAVDGGDTKSWNSFTGDEVSGTLP